MKNLTKLNKNFKLNDETFENVDELLIYSRSISNDIYSFFTSWFDKKEFISVKTSGSTGKPITIQLKKKHMTNSALATGYYFDLHQHTKALLCLSPNFIAGKMMLVRAMVLGWQLDIVEPDAHPLDKTKSNYKFCAMVPLQLSNSLAQLHRIKILLVGGAPVSNELQDRLYDLSTKIYASYGMTETITHVALKKLNQYSGCELGSVSNYKVLPNVQISIDNRGCLVIEAPKIADKPIVTNDLAELISDNEFKWLGRYDSIINSGGIKLIPEQIEKKLSAVIDCRFFVAGIPDELLGEKLVLVVEDENYVLNDEIATSRRIGIRNDEQIRDLKLKIENLNSLHKYEMPKEIFFIDQFIETETKKIQRRQTLDLIFRFPPLPRR